MVKALTKETPNNENGQVKKLLYLSREAAIALMRHCADELEFNHQTISQSEVVDRAIKAYCSAAAAKRKR